MTNNNFLTWGTGNNHFLFIFSWDSIRICKFKQYFCNLFRVIFLDAVTNIVDHNHLELALHLGNSKFFVHSVTTCKKEGFRLAYL